MAKVKVVPFERSIAIAGDADLAPDTEHRAYLNRASDPLHLLHHKLAPRCFMKIVGDDNDKLIYVLAGTVIALGQELLPGSSLIAEFCAAVELTAGPDGATILEFYQAERQSGARPGGHLHILPRDRVPTTRDLGTQNEMGGGIHADAGCPNCSLWLHENDFHSKSGTIIPLHAHSEDEIIFVTKGEIRLGNRVCGPGTALAVAAHTMYGFKVPPTGLSFINFRAASPTVLVQNGTVVLDEAETWISKLGKPPYIHTVSV